MKRAKQFFVNGIMLALTSVFLRGSGLAFNVYITRQIGAEGMGLFGLIMSVYMLANTVATSGAYLAATRMVTEEMTLGQERGMQKAMGVCLAYALFFGLLSASLLFFFAPIIGVYWLCDERTIKPLCYLSISLPFVALSAAINGFFAACRKVIKSATAQVLEILIKVILTVVFLHFSAGKGVESACVAIVAGGSLAEIFSFLYLFCMYYAQKRKLTNGREGQKRYFYRFSHFALPIAISSYVRSGLVTLEHILIPAGLKRYGASGTASLAQYGVVHGMVMPLLLFPASILGAFSGLLVPELTEFQTKGNQFQIKRVASRALQKTLRFSVGASGLFLGFGHELGMVFYKSGDAGMFISVLAPLTVVMYMDGVVDSMLKGLGQQMHSMRYNIIDSALSVCLIYFLLPRFGVGGYVAVLFVAELLNAFLSFNRLIRVTDCGFSLGRYVLLPALAMAVSVFLMRYLGNCFSTINLWCLVLGAGVCYLLLLQCLKRFGRE